MARRLFRAPRSHGWGLEPDSNHEYPGIFKCMLCIPILSDGCHFNFFLPLLPPPSSPSFFFCFTFIHSHSVFGSVRNCSVFSLGLAEVPRFVHYVMFCATTKEFAYIKKRAGKTLTKANKTFC